MDVRKQPVLLTPGPTPVPSSALSALARQVVPHRGAEFLALFAECRAGLAGLLAVSEPPVFLTCPGTGAMEAAAVNVLAPGDHALCINSGRFGARWKQICESTGAVVNELNVPWGAGVTPGRLAAAMSGAAPPRAVFLQGVESSTGALLDVAALAAEAKRHAPDCLVVVDGMTWFGAHAVTPESTGIDVLTLSSQKALGAPPGLAFVWASARAWERIEANQRPRYFFDLRRERKHQNSGQGTTFTPAVNTVRALGASINEINARGGIAAMIANAAKCAAMTRDAAAGLGLAVFAQTPSNAITALTMPPGVNSTAVQQRLASEHGIFVADGQEELKGKLIRIGHLGFVTEADTRAFTAALHHVLSR